MYKNYVILILFFLSSQLFGQSNPWKILLNTSDDRQVYDIIEGEANNIYFTGSVREQDCYDYSGFVYKTDFNGFLVDSCFYSNTDSSIVVTSILKDASDTYTLGLKTFNKTSEFNGCGFLLRRINTELNTVKKSKSYLFPTNYHGIQTYVTLGLNNNIITFGYIFTGVYSPRMFIYETNYLFDSIKAKIFINDGSIVPMKLKQLNSFNYWIIGEVHPKYLLIDLFLLYLKLKPALL